MDAINPNLQKFMSLQMVSCNDSFFSHQTASFIESYHAMNSSPRTIKSIYCCPIFHQPSNHQSTISLWAPVPQVSTGNFVLFGHQAALTYSLLYFCLQVCHRMIQWSSALLTQRQWAIRVTFVTDWLYQQGDCQVDCQTNQPVVIQSPFLPSLLVDSLLSDSWIIVL